MCADVHNSRATPSTPQNIWNLIDDEKLYWVKHSSLHPQILHFSSTFNIHLTMGLPWRRFLKKWFLPRAFLLVNDAIAWPQFSKKMLSACEVWGLAHKVSQVSASLFEDYRWIICIYWIFYNLRIFSLLLFLSLCLSFSVWLYVCILYFKKLKEHEIKKHRVCSTNKPTILK